MRRKSGISKTYKIKTRVNRNRNRLIKRYKAPISTALDIISLRIHI